MAQVKSINHAYLLIKFTANLKPHITIVQRESIRSIKYSLDETIFIKLETMIRQCTVISTSDDIYALANQYLKLREEHGYEDYLDEEMEWDEDFVADCFVDEPDTDDSTVGAQKYLEESQVSGEDAPSPTTKNVSDRMIAAQKYLEESQDSGKDAPSPTTKNVSDRMIVVQKYLEESQDSGKNSPRPTTKNVSDRMISFGPNGSSIKERFFETINWNCYVAATRELLSRIFSKKILATHTLTGRPGRSYENVTFGALPQLNLKIVEDIIAVVQERCKVKVSAIRKVISQKCVAEGRVLRRRARN